MTRWNNMHERVEDYLSARRRVGYQLKSAGKELFRFARFTDKHGNHTI